MTPLIALIMSFLRDIKLIWWFGAWVLGFFMVSWFIRLTWLVHVVYMFKVYGLSWPGTFGSSILCFLGGGIMANGHLVGSILRAGPIKPVRF